MTTGGERPYGSHRFRVSCERLPGVGFTEVRGLAVAVEVRPEGESAERAPGPGAWRGWDDWAAGRDDPAPPARRRARSPTLELRRGVTDDEALFEWLRAWVAGDADPQDVRVCLLDGGGDPVRGWVCRGATPVRWTGPELVAARAAVATEALELTHEGVDAMADLSECCPDDGE